MTSYAHAYTSAPDTAWTRIIGGDNEDYGNCIIETHDGNLVIVGTTNSYGAGDEDVYLIKMTSDGDTLWTKTYGGTNGDYGNCVAETHDHGFIITGKSADVQPLDVYLIRTDSTGNVLWTKLFGNFNYEWGASVIETYDDGFVIAGYVASSGTDYKDLYLIKTNSSGEALWTKTFGDSGSEAGYSVVETRDSGLLVVGTTTYSASGTKDVYAVKTNSSGESQWIKTYGGTADDAGYSVVESDSGYIIAGYTESYGTNGDFYLLKINLSGEVVWSKTYGGAESDAAYSIIKTLDGGFLVAGTTYSYGEGNGDFYLLKMTSSGDTVWTKTIGGINDDFAKSVIQTDDSGYAAVGFTYTNNAPDVYIVKLKKEASSGSINTYKQIIPIKSFNVFPNPFKTSTRIQVPAKSEIRLYDINGRLLEKTEKNIVGSDLQTGTYFVNTDGHMARITKVK